MQSAFEKVQALGRRNVALFLDFDGTLTPIVDHPDQVRVDSRLINSLSRLKDQLHGALAIISGREIAVLDRFFSPHTFPASGVHGLESRIPGGETHCLQSSEAALAAAVERLDAEAARHAGLLVERKRGSVALHYRARPELYETCRKAVEDAVAGTSGLSVVEGKMVFEVKAHGGSKGTAIQAFMQEPPFQSRTPVFVGDDVTDEAGFAAVNALGGISIKVGAGETVAQYRLDGPAEVAAWLDALADKHVSEMSGRATAK